MKIIIIILLLIVIFICVIYKFYNRKDLKNNIFHNYIYLDNNGTTEMLNDAFKSYITGAGYGNVSGIYAKEGNDKMEETTEIIKHWVQAPNHDVIYTSGGSESNSEVLKAVFDDNNQVHMITTSYEHKSIINTANQLKEKGLDITFVKPNKYGLIEINDIINSIKPNTKLISVMAINNETGNINNIFEMVKQVKKINPNILFHTDAVQAFGKFRLTGDFDAISVSAHKLNGPTGLGLLIISPRMKEILKKNPLINGEQQSNIRGGTINISSISAFNTVLKYMIKDRTEKNKKMLNLKKKIINYLSNNYNVENIDKFYDKSDNQFDILNNNISNTKYGVLFIGEGPTSPNTILVSILKYGSIKNHFCNIKLREDLFKEGCIIGIGSTCNSKNINPSHVLTELKLPFVVRCGVIRISVSEHNTEDEIKEFCEKLSKCIEKQN